MSTDNSEQSPRIPDSGKNRYVTAAITFFLGWIGGHKFYLGQMKKGILFAVFFWTMIPWLVSLAQVVHYLIMNDDEFHSRVQGEYKSSQSSSSLITNTDSNSQEESVDSAEESKSDEDDSSGYIRDIPDAGLSHEDKDFDIGKALGDDVKYLDDDEEVKYIIKGKNVEIEGGVEKERTGSSIGKKMKTVVTNKRVLLIIPQRLKGTDTKTIMYDNIAGVDISSGYLIRKLRIQSLSQVYDIHILSEEVAEQAVDYIRERHQEASQTTEEVTAPAPDPTEQLKNLKELNESGTISDEEFEEKKDELMEKI